MIMNNLLIPAWCKILIYLGIFFTPIYASMISVFILITFDTITGIIKSHKKGDTISSKKLKTTIIKVLLYQMTIITAHMIELHLLPYIPVVKVVLGSIATIEFFSILENVSNVTGRPLLTVIKEKIEKLLK